MPKKLHIICFDIPYPANYGGAIDVYYKILNLSKLGIKITLHCFKYGKRNEQEKLAQLCEHVYYYPRLKYLAIPRAMQIPFIVASRKNNKLLKNLQADSSPILFEGLHTCYYLNHDSLKQRKKLVRMHNIEWQYYQHLAQNESLFFKKIFFKSEAKKLQKFEENLHFSNEILAISQTDFAYLNQKFKKVTLLNVFSQNEYISSKKGFGEYHLYHGNLSVSENVKAAHFLIDIYKTNNIELPLVIAGKNPNKSLIEKVKTLENIKIIANPSEQEMKAFIENAHINLLPTFQATGIKLKLINALYKGRFCIANKKMLQGTNLENTCIIANSANEFVEAIYKYTNKFFNDQQITERQKILMKNFNNCKNAEILVHLIN